MDVNLLYEGLHVGCKLVSVGNHGVWAGAPKRSERPLADNAEIMLDEPLQADACTYDKTSART